MKKPTLSRKRMMMTGQVQGVGFRPFVYRLAHEYALTGSVANTPQGVLLEIQGSPAAVAQFMEALHLQLPPLAVITSCTTESCPPSDHESTFSIIQSRSASEDSPHSVLISPDTAICEACLADMADTKNRRYAYPFTNCTNCGPRYTITHSIPYDRSTTAMACFPLCPQCAAEYADPLDRRFHAQPNACPVCGPRLSFVHASQVAQDTQYPHQNNSEQETYDDTALTQAAQALRQGCIVAIKGLGGFHLCCDATHADSIARLRKSKQRPHKALAIMVPCMRTAHALAYINDAEAALLCSAEKPIVLCTARAGQLPQALSPDTHTLGIMLPYTPLHVALFREYVSLLPQGAIAALVMTSGNAGGEPICLGNREAMHRLRALADAFVLHNRDILVRTDDSVCAIRAQPLAQTPTDTIFYRRARGYVPRPIMLHTKASVQKVPSVLGMGAQLKSTLCLTRANTAFVSQHIGTLETMETGAFYEEVLAHFEMLLQVRAEVLVHDAHPDFFSTHLAKRLAAQRHIPCYALQHHFAHAHSVLAEHRHMDKALVLALDGTGLGDDGTVWGGELLFIHGQENMQRRVGRLSPFVMIGGDKATQEPWRLALALAHSAQLPLNAAHWHKLGVNEQALYAVQEMLTRHIQCLHTSSAGRLFDAVAAGLGLCGYTTYEGQAAIRLEQVQSLLPLPQPLPPQTIFASKNGDLWELSSQALFAECLARHESTHMPNTPFAAQHFHISLAQGLADMTLHAAHALDVHTVALTGGVLQNATLHHLLRHIFLEHNMHVLTHAQLPAGDGGISLGQAAWGLWQSS